MKKDADIFLRRIIILLFSIAFIFLSVKLSEQDKVDVEKEAQSIQTKLDENIRFVDEFVAEQKWNDYLRSNELFFANKALFKTLDSLEASVFVFKNDTLKLWSTENISPYISDVDSERTLKYVDNGYYYVSQTNNDSVRVVTMMLIQTHYQYRNEYLPCEFNPLICNKNYFHIAEPSDSIVAKINIENVDSSINLCYIDEDNEVSSIRELGILFCLLIGLSLAVIAFRKIIMSVAKIRKNNLLRFFVVVFTVVAGYFFSDFFIGLDFYSNLKINAVESFAISNRFNGLLSFIIFIYWLVILLIFITHEILIFPTPKKNNIIVRTVANVLTALFVFIVYCFTIDFLDKILFNTTIPLSFDDVTHLDAEISFIFIILFAIFACLALLHYCMVLILAKSRLTSNMLIFYFVAAFVFCFVATIVLKIHIVDAVLVFIYILSLQLIFVLLAKSKKTLYLFIHIVSAAIFATHVINTVNDKKQMENLQLMSLYLATEQDPLAEDIFDDIRQTIENDSILEKHIVANQNPDMDISEYLKREYFGGYLNQYQIQTTVCSKKDEIVIQPSREQVNCYEYFDNISLLRGVPTLSENMFFIDDGIGRGYYMAMLNYGDSINEYYLFLELIPMSFEKDMGYPNLLVDQENVMRAIPQNVSFARYLNNVLVSHYGKYPYSIGVEPEISKALSGDIVNSGKYIHLKINLDEKLFLVITATTKNFFDKLFPFTYLFIAFSVLSIFIILPCKRLWQLNMNLKSTFVLRLRLMILCIMVASSVIAAFIAIVNMNSLNKSKNEESISEKTHSFLINLENKIQLQDSLTAKDVASLTPILLELSNIYFTDANIYSLEGELMATSRPQIFDKSLRSKKINPRAFKYLTYNQNSFFSQVERIGKMSFTSAYIPVRGLQNNVVAYLNLPFFAKEEELNREISSFTTTFINIYLIIIFITILVTVFISNYVTRPLKLIKDKLRGIKLNSTNEKILWKQEDEIGELIDEYNRMIDELARNAELLARNERELAWREMARQVAHEIKNPLTPMKLSTQYLERAWNDKSENFDERLKRFASMMVEQIDNLAEIATEFSNFGKMPDSKMERICLNKIIEQVVVLFKDEDYDIDFRQPDFDVFVIADESRMIRVFNNLLKNAQQAFCQKRRGKIDVELTCEKNKVFVIVADNGSGISVESRKKIFQPNFTTKTSGTGLGLAMVKSILNEMDADINFKSVENEGTTFFIEMKNADF